MTSSHPSLHFSLSLSLCPPPVFPWSLGPVVISQTLAGSHSPQGLSTCCSGRLELPSPGISSIGQLPRILLGMPASLLWSCATSMGGGSPSLGTHYTSRILLSCAARSPAQPMYLIDMERSHTAVVGSWNSLCEVSPSARSHTGATPHL